MITGNTQLKELIKQKPDSINIIRKIYPEFAKIEPITYQMYAENKVLIKDLAKLAKIPVNELLKHLENFGFDVKFDIESEVITQDEINEAPIDVDTSNLVTLDVRPTIAQGKDPFDEIMEAVKTLKPDETLRIINVFVPIPLVNLMKRKGYKTWTNEISDKEYHTYFIKADSNKTEEKSKEKTVQSTGSFEEVLASFGDKVKKIDVRHLEMPQPMITILEELQNLPDDHALFVNHKKIPQFLLPELESRNYKWLTKKIDDDNLLFLVFKN